MCPSPLVPLDIHAFSTDEDLVLFLGGRRVGDPIPPNVITEVNPFSIEPWDSPEEMWFLYNYKESQSPSKGSIIEVTRIGYWKFMDDLRISTSTTAVGRKTTRQFYIGQAPSGDRTGWMMHEYHAEKMSVQGNSKTQDSSFLCRLFLQFDEWPNNGEQCYPMSPEQCHPGLPKQCDPPSPEHCDPASPQLSEPVGVESTLLRILEEEEEEEEEGNSSQNAANNSQVGGESEERRPELSVRSPQDLVPPQDLVNGNSMDDMQAICDFSKGDFLELKDLYDPESSSTSSDNSSLMSMNSGDHFDAEALLRDIENESSLNQEEDRVDYRFNISTSVRSNQVVIRPPPSASGSAYGNNCNLVVVDAGSPALSSSTVLPEGHGDASVVNDTNSGSSQGGTSPRGSRSKSARRIAKLGKSYCCFRSF